jgi:hypothetical protein
MSDISLDEKERLRSLQNERMYLRETLSRPPQMIIDVVD